MLDKDFNIKLIDFGFCAPIEGRDQSGYLRTYLGTKGFMAPEIHEGLRYKGAQVDLFSLGVILFCMVS